jgi:hypothetical protein
MSNPSPPRVHFLRFHVLRTRTRFLPASVLVTRTERNRRYADPRLRPTRPDRCCAIHHDWNVGPPLQHARHMLWDDRKN